MAQNPSKPESLPTPRVSWEKLRDHGKPNAAAEQTHEDTLAKLDDTDRTRGGRRDER